MADLHAFGILELLYKIPECCPELFNDSQLQEQLVKKSVKICAALGSKFAALRENPLSLSAY